MIYDVLFDRFLSRTDPERAHHAALLALRLAGPTASRLGGGRQLAPTRRQLPPTRRQLVPTRRVSAMGIDFPNALGLAAGFDKNAVAIDSLGALGFGHVEIGTVTGEPQPGNPAPRLFRLPADRAVVNRMGFNNDGAEVVGQRLAARAARHRPGPVLGVNIGKTKVVPEDDLAAVVRDHEKSVTCLAPYADYLVVNVSSPNTPGLRTLQAVEKLQPLLRAVRARADQVTADRVPLAVKIAPDLDDDDVLAVADLAVAERVDGIIATNTTVSRDGLRTGQHTLAATGAGGLSGPPLASRSLEVLRLLRGRVGEAAALISVGGITTPADARVRLEAGASLVQGYTALVYEGPAWPRRVLRELRGPVAPHGSAGVTAA